MGETFIFISAENLHFRGVADTYSSSLELRHLVGIRGLHAFQRLVQGNSS